MGGLLPKIVLEIPSLDAGLGLDRLQRGVEPGVGQRQVSLPTEAFLDGPLSGHESHDLIWQTRWAEGDAYLSYQPSRKARPRVPLNRLNISQAGVASLSISIVSASRASAAKM